MSPTSDRPEIWRLSCKDVVSSLSRWGEVEDPDSGQMVIRLGGGEEARLDRFEVDCLDAESKNCQFVASAAATRVLSEDLARVVKNRESLTSAELELLLERGPQMVRDSWPILTYLERFEGMADPASAKRYHLSRERLEQAISKLAEAFRSEGFPMPERDEEEDELGGKKLGQVTDAAVSAVAKEKTPVRQAPARLDAGRRHKETLLLLVLLVLMVSIAGYNFWPRGPKISPLDTSAVESILPLDRLWKKADVVYGIVTTSWLGYTEEHRKTAVEELYRDLAKSQEATRLILYQPNGRVLAAVADAEKVTIMTTVMRS